MSIEYLLGILCGVTLGLILIWVLLKWTKKDGSSKCRYDERQQIVRGQAFKAAFFTLIFCDALYALEDAIVEKQFLYGADAMGMCIIISVVVYACYCIWNEGYFALNENRKRVLVAFALIALMNFVIFGIHAVNDGIWEEGMLAPCILNLFCGVMFLVIFSVMLMKRMQNRSEEE